MKTASRLEKVLESGAFAVTSECGPPRGADPQVIREKGELLRGVVDGINVTDNQTSVVRMSSIAACVILKEMGFDPILQMTTRGRNRIALQSDLLGAAALGMNNLLCLSGDHQSFGDHPTSKNVYDIDSIQLIQTVYQMREEGKFINGEAEKRGLGNIRTIHSHELLSLPPVRSIDLIFIRNVCHHLTDRTELFSAIEKTYEFNNRPFSICTLG